MNCPNCNSALLFEEGKRDVYKCGSLRAITSAEVTWKSRECDLHREIKELTAIIKRLEDAGSLMALRLSSWRLKDGQWMCSGDKDAWDGWQQAKDANPSRS